VAGKAEMLDQFVSAVAARSMVYFGPELSPLEDFEMVFSESRGMRKLLIVLNSALKPDLNYA
jgi:hypothetical protein